LGCWRKFGGLRAQKTFNQVGGPLFLVDLLRIGEDDCTGEMSEGHSCKESVGETRWFEVEESRKLL